MKGDYGTQIFSPYTQCEKCDDRAVGILVERVENPDDGKLRKRCTPLCSKHRDKHKASPEVEEDEMDCRRFID